MSNTEKKEKIVANQNVMVSAGAIHGVKNQKDPVYSDYIENRDKTDEYREDPEIQKLRYMLMERTPQTLRWCANHDNTVVISITILTNNIIGSSGLEAKTENKKDKEWIEEYLERIDYKSVIHRIIKDCIPHAESIQWKDYRDDGIHLQWIDYLTLHPVTNPYTGSRKWIQYTHLDPNIPKNDGAKWKSYEPYLDIYNDYPTVDMTKGVRTQPHKCHIFEDDVIKVQLFTTPPMVTISDIVIWKKYMQYDAKLGGQKYATPLIDAEVDLGELADPNDQEVRNTLDNISDDLARMVNHGTLAHLNKVRLQAIQQSGQIFQFAEYLEYIDKQIHKTILVPKNLLEATGSELATSRTTKDVQSTVIGSIRTVLVRIFEQLVKESAEWVGRKLSPFTLAFSEEDKQQRLTHNEEIMAILQLFDRGIISDNNEIRAYMSKFGIELKPEKDEFSDDEDFGDFSDFGDISDNKDETGLSDDQKIQNDIVKEFNDLETEPEEEETEE